MKQITIATYNIRHGADVGLDWTKLAENIAPTGADIVGIQEVDMGTNRIGGLDTMAGLLGATGYPYGYFIPSMSFDGGRYGTAILSRHPIEGEKTMPLNAEGLEPRAFGVVTVHPTDGEPILFLNTHLSYENPQVQSVQFTQIARWIRDNAPDHGPVVLTGDFNTADFTAFEPLLAQGFCLVNNEEHTYHTFRTTGIAIDNIVYRSASLIPTEQGMIDSDRSDHNLLWCRFEIC